MENVGGNGESVDVLEEEKIVRILQERKGILIGNLDERRG